MGSRRYTKKEAYAMLGLKENATDAEAKKRYHLLMKSVHPDSSGDELTDYVSSLNAAWEAIIKKDFLPEAEPVYEYHKPYSPSSTESTAKSYEEPAGKEAASAGKGVGDARYSDSVKEGIEKADARRRRFLQFKKVAYPLFYNLLHYTIRISFFISLVPAGLYILCRILNSNTVSAFGISGKTNFLIITVICFAVTFSQVLLKLWIYKSVERDFNWTKEFTI